MTKILKFFKGLFSEWGIDKWAHLGIGGLACTLITIALMLAEHQVSPWRMLLFPLGGAICVFIFSFFKELIDTTGFSWKDILAAMLGCLLVKVAALEANATEVTNETTE